MTGQQIKEALMDKRPVKYQEIEYKCISAVIYRNVGGGVQVSVELLDKNGPFVVVALADRVQEVNHD